MLSLYHKKYYSVAWNNDNYASKYMRGIPWLCDIFGKMCNEIIFKKINIFTIKVKFIWKNQTTTFPSKKPFIDSACLDPF